MKQRAAFYARVSSARQEQEGTIDSQVDALRSAAKAMNLDVSPERYYVDDGFSGAYLARPGLDALRDAAADGSLDVVFLHCPDRLARSFVHQHVLIEELSKHGVDIQFVERPISDRAEDRLLVQMQGVIAEYERAKIIERTRRGKLHKLRVGQMIPYGTQAPYGYAIVAAGDPPRRTVVIDEVEAQHVRTIYGWVLQEALSARAVAKRLNAQGIRPRRGKIWCQGTVYNVLTNPAYAGQAVYNRRESCEPRRPREPGAYRKQHKSSNRRRDRKEWLTVAIPPLVTEQMQNDVRELLAKHKVWAPRNVQHPYLLRTLVVCGDCGWRMQCVRQPSRPSCPYEYFYYGCRHHDPVETGRTEKCGAKRVRRDELDRVVWDAIVAWIESPRMLEEEIQAWRCSRTGAEQEAKDRARAEAAERQATVQIERLVDAYQNGAISVDELKVRRERLEATRQAARTRGEELIAAAMDQARLDQIAQDLEAFASTLRSGLQNLDFEGRQRLVRLLVERVVVTGDQVAIEHAIPLSGRFHGLQLQRR